MPRMVKYWSDHCVISGTQVLVRLSGENRGQFLQNVWKNRTFQGKPFLAKFMNKWIFQTFWHKVGKNFQKFAWKSQFFARNFKKYHFLSKILPNFDKVYEIWVFSWLNSSQKKNGKGNRMVWAQWNSILFHVRQNSYGFGQNIEYIRDYCIYLKKIKLPSLTVQSCIS